VVKTVVSEFQYADVAVGGGTGEQAPVFVRRPRDKVDRRFVQRKVEYSLPLTVLLSPDKHLAIIAGRREDVPVFGVGPGYTPHSTFMAIA
jgi:hypothetical protein